MRRCEAEKLGSEPSEIARLPGPALSQFYPEGRRHSLVAPGRMGKSMCKLIVAVMMLASIPQLFARGPFALVAASAVLAGAPGVPSAAAGELNKIAPAEATTGAGYCGIAMKRSRSTVPPASRVRRKKRAPAGADRTYFFASGKERICASDKCNLIPASCSNLSGVMVTTFVPRPSNRPMSTWMDSTLPSGPFTT